MPVSTGTSSCGAARSTSPICPRNSRERQRSDSRHTSSPSNSTWPLSGRSIPAATRSSEVLPCARCAITVTLSPACRSNEISFRTRTTRRRPRGKLKHTSRSDRTESITVRRPCGTRAELGLLACVLLLQIQAHVLQPLDPCVPPCHLSGRHDQLHRPLPLARISRLGRAPSSPCSFL